MKLKLIFNKKNIFILISILSIIGYSFVVFAAAPSGGYTPGSTLDPDCAPGDTDCVVAFVAGGTSSPAGSDTQIQYNNAGAFGADAGFSRTATGVTNISSTFGDETLQYQITDNMLGSGKHGILTQFTVPLGGLMDYAFSDGGDISSAKILSYPSMSITTESEFSYNKYSAKVTVGTDQGNLNITSQESSLTKITDLDGIGSYKTGFRTSGGSATIGDIDGGNNTKITIDDIAQTINFNNNYSFPFADGAAGQVLGTDGSGQLGWVTVSGGSVSPISIGTSGNTLYSSGLSGTGQGDTSTGNNIFLGINAGNGATSASYSNFFGYSAGYNATDASGSNFFGPSAGQNATYANHSNFFGVDAGNGATNAYYSNFFGVDAGNGALNANASNFFGKVAGYGATGASNSNFFGVGSGYGATGASNSNFLGESAGSGSANAYNSNFFGQNAGRQSTNASNSTFIGKNAGYNDLVNNTLDTDDFSILIGNNTSTGGFSNSIALGGYATNTASNQFMIGSVTRPITSMVLTGDYSGGSCTFAVGGMSCSSDERLKTNIEDLQGSTLDTILNIRTVNYNWNSSSDSPKQVGFIAQDLQQYFPELVSVGQGGYLQVNYAQMTPILVEAIREMNLKITAINDSEIENSWRDSLIAWFGNVGNGITELFVGRVRTHELCLDDVCVTKDQLQQLLQNSQQTIVPSSSGNPPTDPDPEITPDDAVPSDSDPIENPDDSGDSNSDTPTDDIPTE